jgi:hypothetical protein
LMMERVLSRPVNVGHYQRQFVRVDGLEKPFPKVS